MCGHECKQTKLMADYSPEDSLSPNILSEREDEDELFLSAYESQKLKQDKYDDKEEDIFTEAPEYLDNTTTERISSVQHLSDKSHLVEGFPVSSLHESYGPLRHQVNPQHFIEISVREPKKVGDGLNSFIVYKVITKTNISEYRNSQMEVYRRFSDFLGLHNKLVEKHLHHGTIIPPPPEKNVFGTTRVKMSKDDASTTDFVERRRISLERFMRCLSRHPTLRVDPAFVDFLELDGDLPRSTSTSALSSTQVLKLLNKVGEGIGKMGYKVEEADQWFEDKQQQMEMIEFHLKKLHASIEPLILCRKDMAHNAGSFSKNIDLLSTTEEHAPLSRALSRLADIFNRTEQLCLNQSDNDFLIPAELVREYIGLCQSVKEVFQERVKLYKLWKDEEVVLKKDARAKTLNRSNVHGVNEVEKCKEEFEGTSKNIMEEVERFEEMKLQDFKSNVIQYFESLRDHQLQVAQLWEAYLSELNSIA